MADHNTIDRLCLLNSLLISYFQSEGRLSFGGFFGVKNPHYLGHVRSPMKCTTIRHYPIQSWPLLVFMQKALKQYFLYIEAIFYAVGNFLYFYVWSVSVANMRIGRALLYCVSFRILLNLRHLLSWLYGVTSCILTPHELHWLHWAMTVRSKVLTKSINEIVEIPRNRLSDGQYDTERYCH